MRDINYLWLAENLFFNIKYNNTTLNIHNTNPSRPNWHPQYTGNDNDDNNNSIEKIGVHLWITE